ncbi:MAG: DNA gyrase inhibitor YacG [Rhodobacterales bacterium]|jgi:endogenous inhibitor of DNA gyrase (YacG/DUF329 family)|uniref:DNA gyrase inhibitor YacG n=1 Tax=uncultured Planktomarina sp. TaxID=1538529 RepID=UPI0032618E2A
MTCPICKKPTSESDRPFCSPRCKDIDLSKWLIGGYVIANNYENESSEVEDAGEDHDN